MTVFVCDLEPDERDFLNSFQRSLQMRRGASISKILSFKAKEGSIDIVHLPMVNGRPSRMEAPESPLFVLEESGIIVIYPERVDSKDAFIIRRIPAFIESELLSSSFATACVTRTNAEPVGGQAMASSDCAGPTREGLKGSIG